VGWSRPQEEKKKGTSISDALLHHSTLHLGVHRWKARTGISHRSITGLAAPLCTSAYVSTAARICADTHLITCVITQFPPGRSFANHTHTRPRTTHPAPPAGGMEADGSRLPDGNVSSAVHSALLQLCGTPWGEGDLAGTGHCTSVCPRKGEKGIRCRVGSGCEEAANSLDTQMSRLTRALVVLRFQRAVTMPPQRPRTAVPDWLSSGPAARSLRLHASPNPPEPFDRPPPPRALARWRVGRGEIPSAHFPRE